MQLVGDGWRHDYANIALGGGNLMLVLIGFKLQSVSGWFITLSLLGLTSFWAWYANLKRYRTIADTPTSRIVSAPQGYIEIAGRGVHPPGDPLVSPLSGLPCLWYRYRIEKREGDRWTTIESATSDDTFGVNDGSGMMLVDPDGAEILTSRKQTSREGNYRRTEWTLIAGETVYVIGEHATLGGANASLDTRADIAALLAEWKQDKPALLSRFDTNKDGEVDLAEWEVARRLAAEEVNRAHLDIRLQPGVQIMRQPGHRRPYLIANRAVEALTRHYQLWSVFHLSLLSGSVAGILLLAGKG